MNDTHSAHLVELNQIDDFRQEIQTIEMLTRGMRCALLDALDRWQTQTPLQFFLCVIAPNGHVNISLCTMSKLEETVLRALSELDEAYCAWHLSYIGDEARLLWEEAAELFEFIYPNAGLPAPSGVTLH